MLRPLLGAGLLLLGACQAAPPETAPPAEAPTAEVPPPAPAPAADAVGIALDGEGLRLVVEPSGSTRLLAFGAGRDEATSVLETAGHPVTDEGTNAECGAGPLAFASVGGLSLLFQDGAFVGWSTDSRTGGGAGLTTMAGVGVGSPRADLESAYAAEVQETTLVTEFVAGGLGGILSGPGPDATVTTLWAGTPCAFR